MSITRERKREIVAQYTDLMSKSPGLFLASYSGLSVRDLEDLRAKVREIGGEFHIVKNRLLARAFEDAGLPVPEGSLQGTTAMGFAMEDIPGMAKAIVDLTREAEGFMVKGGVIEGNVYDVTQIERLADLPPLAVLRAQILGLLQAPASGIAGVIAGSVRGLVDVLSAYSEQAESAES